MQYLKNSFKILIIDINLYQFDRKCLKSNNRLKNEQTETFSFRFVFLFNLFDQIDID